MSKHSARRRITALLAAVSISAAGVTLAPAAPASADTPSTIAAGDTWQTVDFGTLPWSGKVGEVATLNGWLSSGLPVQYVTSGGCQAVGNQLTYVHVGICTLYAGSSGNDVYGPVIAGPRAISVYPGFQKIAFSVPSTGRVGDRVTLTATGGTSGSPVTFSGPSAGPSALVCSIDGAELSLNGPGTCDVTASQAGNLDYSAAEPVVAFITVSQHATAVSLTPGAPVTYGQDSTLTADVTGVGNGTIQLTVDGKEAAGSADVVDGSASLALPKLGAGTHTVTGQFTPTDSVTYSTSTSEPAAVVVGKAATELTLTHAGDTFIADVSPAGTGAVTFSVDGDAVQVSPLDDGKATYTLVNEPGTTRTVSATYDGDDNYLPSSAVTTRTDDSKVVITNPTITATTSGKTNKSGWRRAPVTVTFTCAAGSSPLVGNCPAPVRLWSGAGQIVSRTVIAADGGVATITVTGINVDTKKPTVKLRGVTKGKSYQKAPKVKCAATDTTSGVASCKVKKTTKGQRMTYKATVKDRAGNVAHKTVTIKLKPVTVTGARFRHGAYEVRAGRTYTVVAHAKVAPLYYVASRKPARPSSPSVHLRKVGKNKWSLGVQFDPAMSGSNGWQFGVKVDGKVVVVPVRVVR